MSEDIKKLRLETENLQLKCALEFYAEGRHLWHADKRDATTHKEYDSVSGVVENGAYAFKKLREIEDELPEKIVQYDILAEVSEDVWETIDKEANQFLGIEDI